MENNKKSNGRMLTGMFADRESAENAYDTMHERGYSKDDINLLMSNDTRKRYYSEGSEKTDLGSKATESAGTGSVIGGTLGAIAGAIAAIGTSVFVPGFGILVAGPIVAGLAGAGAGSITGGLLGGLIGLGIPEDRAKLYESGINNGHVVMGVRPRNEEDAEYFENTWRANKGEEIYR